MLVNRDRITVHPSENCDLFYDLFTGISHVEDEPELPAENHEPVNELSDFNLTEQEVRDQLNILNITKSSGPDGIAPIIL